MTENEKLLAAAGEIPAFLRRTIAPPKAPETTPEAPKDTAAMKTASRLQPPLDRTPKPIKGKPTPAALASKAKLAVIEGVAKVKAAAEPKPSATVVELPKRGKTAGQLGIEAARAEAQARAKAEAKKPEPKPQPKPEPKPEGRSDGLRAGSKMAQALDMTARKGGASCPEIAKAIGWTVLNPATLKRYAKQAKGWSLKEERVEGKHSRYHGTRKG